MRKPFIAVLFLILFSSSAFAQASRVWVSGVGDDLNPCSRTAPCKTFTGALNKVAAGGEIDILDAGGYGAVTIDKAVTIDGGGAFAGILVAGVPGVVINASASATVTLRNLNISGSATSGSVGVQISSAGRVVLENVNIANLFTGQGLGLDIAAATTVAITNCTINSTIGAAIFSHPATGTAKLVIARSRFDSDATALFLQSNTVAAVYESTLTHNGLGVFIADATSSAHIHASTLSENGMGVNVSGPVTFFGSQVVNNDLAFATSGAGEVRTHGNNAILNNANPGATPVPVGLQ